MPKKSKGMNNTRMNRSRAHRPIEYPNDKFNQKIAVVESALGECHFNVITVENESKRCSLKGTVKRCGRIRAGDTVLIEPLDENKYQIIFKYTVEQTKLLEKEGRIEKAFDTSMSFLNDSIEEDDDDGFEFENEVKQNQHTQDEELKKAAQMKQLEDMINNV